MKSHRDSELAENIDGEWWDISEKITANHSEWITKINTYSLRIKIKINGQFVLLHKSASIEIK